MSVNPDPRSFSRESVDGTTETSFEEVKRQPLLPSNPLPQGTQSMDDTKVWIPVTDIVSDEKAYFIQVEVPGIQKEQISVQRQKEVLTFTLQKLSPSRKNPLSIHRKERIFGFASRSFRLPTDARESIPDWTLQDGILVIQIDRGSPLKIPQAGGQESLHHGESKPFPQKPSSQLDVSGTPTTKTKPR